MAFEHVRALVKLGPRPPGSEAIEKARSYIISHLEKLGYQVERDAFVATTPYGPKKMSNLVARTGSGANGILVLATHYDTKFMEGVQFVGANDGGSGTGLLLELARVLAGRKGKLDCWLVFLDGEEAFVEWSTFDSTYGSRHLAKKWKEQSVTSRIRALLLLDMIGDRNLDLLRDQNSTRWLLDLVWEEARAIGLSGILSPDETSVQDDHIPFLDAGVAAVDLIDLNYPPWHTPNDTLDKISAESLEKVGRLVLAVIPKIEGRFER
jgi:Zn-dependent M28 family amino/carboxypeptidase